MAEEYQELYKSSEQIYVKSTNDSNYLSVRFESGKRSHSERPRARGLESTQLLNCSKLTLF